MACLCPHSGTTRSISVVCRVASAHQFFLGAQGDHGMALKRLLALAVGYVVQLHIAIYFLIDGGIYAVLILGFEIDCFDPITVSLFKAIR